ncbi:MAG: hypothetical protein ABR936_11975 [Bacteroidota bacterium]|jgi:hypothetical protein
MKLDFLSDNSPVSTMRVAFILAIALFIPCFVFQWTWLSATKGILQTIPDSVMKFLEVLLGGKIIQKGIEVVSGIFKPKDDSPVPPIQGSQQ